MSQTPRVQRTNPLAIVAAIMMGIAVGLVIQFALLGRGAPTLVPPYSLALALVLIGIVLFVFALRLRAQLRGQRGRVDPFQAVRLLAAARAGQLVGGFLGGAGGGLALSLLGRSVPAAVSIWLPMVSVVIAGGVLLACGIFAEQVCRVPPEDPDVRESSDSGGDPAAPSPAASSQATRPHAGEPGARPEL